jgi:hypothetical protein
VRVQRKSVEQRSIENIVMDMTGGILSLYVLHFASFYSIECKSSVGLPVIPRQSWSRAESMTSWMLRAGPAEVS